MDNLKTYLLKAVLPLIILGVILLYFFYNISFASHNGYIFQVKKCGNELKVEYGADSVGDIVMVNSDTVKNNKESCLYAINTRENGYSIYLLLPDGRYIVHNLTGKRFAEIHCARGDIIYGENSETAFKSDSSGEMVTETFMGKSAKIFNKRELFISAIIVHLEMLKLYDMIKIHFIIYIILAAIAYFAYLKPKLIQKIYCKLTEVTDIPYNVYEIRTASFWFLILSPFTILMWLLY